MNLPLREMLRKGPYEGVAHQDVIPVCGFCGEYPPDHAIACPWPAFRDQILQVWPEWVADLNYTDMQERLDKEFANG